MNWHLLRQALRYYLTARHRRGHGIHSPFVYRLIEDVFCDQTPYYATEEIKELYDELLDCSDTINMLDFGAGSQKMDYRIREIKDVTRYSSMTQHYGELLFRLVNYFKPNTILELGSSLGLGTLYLALPNSKAKVYTLEGCPETAHLAQEHYKLMGATNIELIQGRFVQTLPDILQQIDRIDLLFIDGDHRYQSTTDYVGQCLDKCHQESILVLDDIHWSAGMTKAWHEIKQYSQVRVSIDLLRMGLLFLNPKLSRQHLTVRY